MTITSNISTITVIDSTHPKMFLDQAEINAIIARKNDPPWNAAWTDFTGYVNTANNMALQSVTYNVYPTGSDPHSFYDDSAHLHREDYDAAQKMSQSVRSLGLAYKLTGNNSYATKALSHIFNWCIKTETKMNSTIKDNYVFIDLCVTMPSLFYGADLIWNHSGWNTIYNSKTYKTHFKEWTQDIINTVISKCPTPCSCWGCQNLNTWRNVFVASGAVILDNNTLRNDAFNYFKGLIPYQVGDGSTTKCGINNKYLMIKELDRTTSLSYSTYAIYAMTLTAEIAKHFNTDLYHYKYNAIERGLEKVCDKYAPYVTTPSTWPCPQDVTFVKGKDTWLYELAYTRIGNKTIYKDVINKWGRPFYDSKIMGPITLTHATKF